MRELGYVATNPHMKRMEPSDRTFRQRLSDWWHRADYPVTRWEAFRSGASSYPVKGARRYNDHMAVVGAGGIDLWACLACGAYDELRELHGEDVACVPVLPAKLPFRPPKSTAAREKAREETLRRAVRVRRDGSKFSPNGSWATVAEIRGSFDPATESSVSSVST